MLVSTNIRSQYLVLFMYYICMHVLLYYIKYSKQSNNTSMHKGRPANLFHVSCWIHEMFCGSTMSCQVRCSSVVCQLKTLIRKSLIIRQILRVITPCLNKMCKIVFARTSSNFHQFWSFFAAKWQRCYNYARCTHFPPHLIHVTTLPC